MAFFNIRVTGHTSEGETWVTGWWAESELISAEDANVVANVWFNGWWNFRPNLVALQDILSPDTGADQLTTSSFLTIGGPQIDRFDSVLTEVGIGTGQNLPGDNTIVMSIQTALANRRGRGRMYTPPCTTDALAPNGNVSSGTIEGLASAHRDAWDGVNNPVTGLPLCVRSLADLACRPATRIQYGNLMDTQRRRQNKLIETRVTEVLTQG